MTCEEARERLEERLDGPVADLDLHLEECSSCAAEWRRLQEGYGLLLRLAAPPPPEGLERRAVAALRRRGRPLRALAAAALACYLGLGAWLGWAGLQGRGDRPLGPELTRAWSSLPDRPAPWEEAP